jgi:hypothetical protein
MCVSVFCFVKFAFHNPYSVLLLLSHRPIGVLNALSDRVCVCVCVCVCGGLDNGVQRG